MRKPIPTKFRTGNSLLCSVAALLAIPAAGPAYPQQAVLEEIVVTARRREENLQETPQAVTALADFVLRENGVHNLHGLNQLAPNIDVHPANGNGGVANVFIRGVGQRFQAPMIDSGVGIYLDEVYLARADGALLDVNDVESVQVLRGPQGTLFGKNTTGGAILFTTRRPEEETSGAIELRAGNLGRQDAYAVFNLPISDSVLSRFSLARINRDGYLTNSFDNNQYANEDRISAIGQLRWLASADLTIDLNMNYSDTDQSPRLQDCLIVPGVPGWQAVLSDALQVLPATGRSYTDFCQDAMDFGDGRDVISDLGGKYQATTKGVSLTANWALSDTHSVKSISAWRYTRGGLDSELDHTGIPLLYQTQFFHPQDRSHETDQYSQELQLTGETVDGRFNYLLGLYMFSEETGNNRQGNFIGPFYPGASGLFMLNASSSLFEAENSAWAAFVQSEWAISNNWRLTTGIRYTNEKRTLEREQFVVDASTLSRSGGTVAPVFDGAWFVDPGSFNFNPDFRFTSAGRIGDEVGDNDISLLGSLQYLLPANPVIDDGSIYLTFSESFMSGGLSEAPGETLVRFRPESVESLELGIKFDMLDNRLRVNAAAFHADYSDRQLTSLVFSPELNTVGSTTINAARSSISGIELETTWLPSPNLQFSFNSTFNDGDIEEFKDVQLLVADPTQPAALGCSRADLVVLQVDSCPNDRSGENLPRLPKNSYFIAAQYDINTQLGLFTPRVQVSRKADIEYCFDATSCRSGLWLENEQFDLSARISFVSADQHWIAALFGNNLTDEEYLVGGTALTEALGTGGIAVNLPRTYGVEVRYSF
ncbi:MAG: TonB-dependent receptor [Pseudohongiellaceae bacterium]